MGGAARAVSCGMGWVRGGEWVGDGQHTAAAAAVVSVVPGCGEPGGLTGSCRDHTEAGAEPHHPATSINRHTLHAHTPSPPPHAGQPHSPLSLLPTTHFSPSTHFIHFSLIILTPSSPSQQWVRGQRGTHRHLTHISPRRRRPRQWSNRLPSHKPRQARPSGHRAGCKPVSARFKPCCCH